MDGSEHILRATKIKLCNIEWMPRQSGVGPICLYSSLNLWKVRTDGRMGGGGEGLKGTRKWVF